METNMEKEAQFSNMPFLAEVLEEPEKDNIVLEMPENGRGDKKNGENKEIVFKLELVPGADNDTLEVLEDEPVEIDEKTNTPKDDWDWKPLGMSKFLDWVQDRFHNIPKHSGQDLTGLDRAISYCERLVSEIRRAVKGDFKREIDTSKADEALSELHKAIERLEERSNKVETRKFKKSKKSDARFSLVKNAETSITGHAVIMVPYLISNVARACIDATVSGGRDIEECFEKLASEYKLDKREKSQVVQLIKDMGYPMMLDRLNTGKDLKPAEDGVKEYNQQYYA
jgi:hypothetical protein